VARSDCTWPSSGPEVFRGLVIGNTFGWPVNGDMHFEVFSHMMGDAVGQRADRALQFVRESHDPRRPPQEEALQRRDGPLPVSTGYAGAPGSERHLPRAITRSRAFLAQVETNLHTLDRLPALTVWGDADFAFRAKERIRWEGLLHDRSTVVIHGAGHFVQVRCPRRLRRSHQHVARDARCERANS